MRREEYRTTELEQTLEVFSSNLLLEQQLKKEKKEAVNNSWSSNEIEL